MPTLQKTRRIYEFIRGVIASTGEPPTLVEIGRRFEMSSSASVHGHLQKMKDLGWIRRERYSRYIQIVEQEKTKAA